MKNHCFGIVQGRLTNSPPGQLQFFPQENWTKEFQIAKEIGLDYIELFAEREHNSNNPVWSGDGIKKINKLLKDNNLCCDFFCNDYIINHSLKNESCLNQNLKLIKQCSKFGIKNLVLPFFEESEIEKKDFEEYIKQLRRIYLEAKEYHINLLLETSLNAKDLIYFIEILDLEKVGIVYDTGNTISLGHDQLNDILLLSSLIKHVHIKDKNTQGQNVLLGSGMVNFYDIFQALSSIDYRGCYTFETTRGVEPIKTSIFNKQFTEFYIENFN